VSQRHSNLSCLIYPSMDLSFHSTDSGPSMVCSLLRQGMDNLIVSLEGPDAHAIEERAEREGWSRDKVSEVPRFFP